jgi:iron complex outermembrane recepter protein
LVAFGLVTSAEKSVLVSPIGLTVPADEFESGRCPGRRARLPHPGRQNCFPLFATRSLVAAGRALFLCGVAACASHGIAEAQIPPLSVPDLKKLSVAQLMDIEVTSVSKAAERRDRVAAALAVVTNEDIRRSGATSIPEALRLVPGIYVGRQTSSQWAVSSRGFSSVSSEKLLVLSDTRSLYTPLFSGVLWDAQDYMFEDIDRIEVIRGPGATLWGSNAVNGVINITTKNARDTQGTYGEASAGNEERVSLRARHGGRIGERAYYRVFAKFADRDDSFNSSHATSRDDWRTGRVGFRADVDATAHDALTLQGDAYDGDIGQLAPSIAVSGRPGPEGKLRNHISGGNVLARWRHSRSKDSDLQLRVYYDRTNRNDPSFVDHLDTMDVDVQHRFAWRFRQEVTWGGNYRLTVNTNHGKGIFAVDPPSSTDHLFGGFVQSQIRIRDALRVTIGTKVEHNDFSGGEVQPSGRLAWDLSPDQMVWTAVSRAVRVPTRLERDVAIDASDPGGNPIYRLLGNDDFGSERLLAYEAGYRWQPLDSVSVDVAAFHNRYRGLASLEVGTPFVDPHDGRTIVPIENQNLNDGQATGAETVVTAAPLPASRLSASYSYTRLSIDPEGSDLNHGAFLDGATPRHQLGLRSSFDLPARVQFDAQFRYVGAIRRMPQIATGEGIDGYPELDLRVAWNHWKKAEISLVAQNLLHGHHPEFGPPRMRGEVERGAYGKIRWGF